MTNEELEKARIKADMEYDALKDNIHHLAEENKQLKEELETLKDAFDFNLGAIENIRKEKHKLEDKIDKAIEYIKELQNSCIVFSNIAYKELLEILGDKENDNRNN